MTTDDDTAVDDEDSRESTEDETAETVEPEPQSEALQRQQLLIGSGIAALAGIAVAIGGAQQFPGYPVFAYLLAGMVTTAVLFGLLFASIFRGASD